MEPYGDRVTRCGDGKYRWVYEYPMLKNPTILLTTLTLFSSAVWPRWGSWCCPA